MHEIRDWDDLRTRIDLPGRRCYAFFHPALIDEPLIFVEIALTRGIPDAIEPILSTNGQPLDLDRANSAVFYSISNCQRGLSGVSFGHFLIKQVVEEVQCEDASSFSSLCSPRPRLRRVAQPRAATGCPPRSARTIARRLPASTAPIGGEIPKLHRPFPNSPLRAAAWYYLRAHTARGVPRDSSGCASTSARVPGWSGSTSWLTPRPAGCSNRTGSW